MKQLISSENHDFSPVETSSAERAPTATPRKTLRAPDHQARGNRYFIWAIRSLIPLTCAAMLLWLGAFAVPPQGQALLPAAKNAGSNLAASPAAQETDTKADGDTASSSRQASKESASVTATMSVPGTKSKKGTTVVVKGPEVVAGNLQKNKPSVASNPGSGSVLDEAPGAGSDGLTQNAYESLSDTSRLLGGN